MRLFLCFSIAGYLSIYKTTFAIPSTAIVIKYFYPQPEKFQLSYV